MKSNARLLAEIVRLRICVAELGRLVDATTEVMPVMAAELVRLRKQRALDDLAEPAPVRLRVHA